MGGLLQRAGFALPVADSEPLTVRYDSLFALMADLRAMGAANALDGALEAADAQSCFCARRRSMPKRFADPDGRIRASFDVIFLSGWAPHESQQKPLRPGSAQNAPRRRAWDDGNQARLLKAARLLRELPGDLNFARENLHAGFDRDDDAGRGALDAHRSCGKISYAVGAG